MRLLLLGDMSLSKYIIKKASEFDIAVIHFTSDRLDYHEQENVVELISDTIYDAIVYSDMLSSEAIKFIGFYNKINQNKPFILCSSIKVFDGQNGELTPKTIPSPNNEIAKYLLKVQQDFLKQNDKNVLMRSSFIYDDKNYKEVFKDLHPDKIVSPTYLPDYATFILKTTIALHDKNESVLQAIKLNDNILHYSDAYNEPIYMREIYNKIGYKCDRVDQFVGSHEMVKGISYSYFWTNLDRIILKEQKDNLPEKIEYQNNIKISYSTFFDSDGVY